MSSDLSHYTNSPYLSAALSSESQNYIPSHQPSSLYNTNYSPVPQKQSVISPEDYADYPDHLRTERTIDPYEDTSPSYVPVMTLDYLNQPSSNSPVRTNSPIQTSNPIYAQYVSPENAKKDSTITRTDLVALFAILTYTVTIIILSVTVNPLISIALIALPIAIPARLYLGKDKEPDPRADLMNQILQTNQNAWHQQSTQTIYHEDPTQTLHPVYESTNPRYY